MPLICPTCGNSRVFLVKTSQVHVIELKDDRVDVSEETRPAVFEILCDHCDGELPLDEVEDATRRELLLALGAR